MSQCENSLPKQRTQDSLGKEEDSVPQICSLYCDWTLCVRSEVLTCFRIVNTFCKEGRQHHKDELMQLTLTLGVVIPSGSSVVLLTPVSGFLCCASMQFSHAVDWLNKKVIAEELP